MIDTKALRNKILDLAISGKLTERLPEYGNAEDLYAQIQEEKAKLIADGKIKKEKSLPPITEEEIPFEIPDNWKWVRIGSIAVTSTGSTPSKTHPEYYGGNYPFFKPSDLDAGQHIRIASEYLSDEGKNASRQYKEGTILVCCIGSIGKAAIIDVDGTANQQINAVKPIMCNSDYLFYTICNDGFIAQLLRKSRATTIAIVNKSGFDNCCIPLPPLAEQKRIVSAVEDAFVVIDRIEKAQESYYADQEVLKNKIIDAGIRGKLTEQLPEDGNAEDLIKRISNEKKVLIQEGEIPREKALQDIKLEEISFRIPRSWKWVRVQDVASYITDYVANGSFATLKAHTKIFKERNYALFVRTLDLSSGFKRGCSYIDKESYDFLEKSKLYGGELILPNIGASIGKAFIMPDMKMPMSLAPNSILLKFTEPVMNEYFSFVFKSDYGFKLLNKTQGGSATAKFSKTDLRNLVVPLPPLAEQKRIVDIINNLISILL